MQQRSFQHLREELDSASKYAKAGRCVMASATLQSAYDKTLARLPASKRPAAVRVFNSVVTRIGKRCRGEL
jgi:hypothetical protein